MLALNYGARPAFHDSVMRSHDSTSFPYSLWRQVQADIDALPAAHSAASQGAAEADIERQRDDVHQLDVQVWRALPSHL